MRIVRRCTGGRHQTEYGAGPASDAGKTARVSDRWREDGGDTRGDEAIPAAGYGPGAPFARRGRLRGRDSSEENPGWAGKKSIDDGLKQGGDAHLTGSALSGASLLLTRGMIAPPQSFGARPG